MHPGASSARCRSRSTVRSSAIPPLPLRAPPSNQVLQEQHATLILGPPSRLPYIEATMQQLEHIFSEDLVASPARPGGAGPFPRENSSAATTCDGSLAYARIARRFASV